MLPGSGIAQGASLQRLGRWVLLLIITCLLAAVGVAASEPRALAAPPSDADHAQIAQAVANEHCGNLPGMPGLGKLDPKKLCESIIVSNVDPNSNLRGVKSACEAGMAGMGVIGAALAHSQLAVNSCVGVMKKVLTPAQQEYLNKINDDVANAAAKLACVTTDPNTLDCIAKQLNVWLAQGAQQAWSAMSGLLTDTTAAIGVFDHWKNPDVLSLYSSVGAMSAVLMLLFFLIALLVSLVRMDVRPTARAVAGVVTWAVFWAGGVALALAALRASDGAAQWMAGSPDATGRTALSRASDKWVAWINYFSEASRNALPKGVPHPAYDAGTLVAIAIILFLLIAIGLAFVALLMRNVAVLLMLITLPITLAGRGGPALTRSWLPRVAMMFAALLLAKPILVIAVRLGSALVAVPRAGGTHGPGLLASVLGATIILVAALMPGVIYKFAGGVMAGAAGGNAPRAQSGYSERTAQSAQSSMDVTRLVMQRNAPQARPLTSGGSGSMGLSSAGAGGLRGRLAGGLAGASGPVGAALGAAALVGGTAESAARFAGAQAATAGGVFGDVEGPHVPHPTVPRYGLGGSRQGQTAQPHEPAQEKSAEQDIGGREHADLRVMWPSGGDGGGMGQPLPGKQPLIIPGEVVPNRPDRSTPSAGSSGDRSANVLPPASPPLPPASAGGGSEDSTGGTKK